MQSDEEADEERTKEAYAETKILTLVICHSTMRKQKMTEENTIQNRIPRNNKKFGTAKFSKSIVLDISYALEDSPELAGSQLTQPNDTSGGPLALLLESTPVDYE
ncbi:hypothetical protein RUM44_000431 [Polyplax serrata]|uniref:Uncharacterized protein n=1 Tax=Polyplax serrata TaxID=468196 RepID=A0ABR1B5E5_POLSC